MSETTKPTATSSEARNGFFINNGTFSGHFTTPDGHAYAIRKLEPREVTDPRTGEVATIWGGYATARERDVAAKDAMLQTDFKRTGQRPAELFVPEARDIPLYITLRNQPGKGYTDIGSFWNSTGRYTILARDLGGKNGLRFGGDVLPYKSSEVLEAERAAKAATEHPAGPDGAAAHATLAKPKPGKRRTPEA